MGEWKMKPSFTMISRRALLMLILTLTSCDSPREEVAAQPAATVTAIEPSAASAPTPVVVPPATGAAPEPTDPSDPLVNGIREPSAAGTPQTAKSPPIRASRGPRGGGGKPAAPASRPNYKRNPGYAGDSTAFSGGGSPAPAQMYTAPQAPKPTALPARKPAAETDATARKKARARLVAEAQRRRDDDRRLPFIPHRDTDRFAQLRVLENDGAAGMTFYDYGVNPTISTEEEPTSTFAVDVDSASYGMVRSYLQKGTMPDEAAVRVEEMINAFDYAYAAPDKEPFLVQAEAFPSPNRKGYHVLHLGLKGRDLTLDQRKPATLVFVIDVSGSMEGESRLGLVKRSLTMLTRQLDGRDTVAVVVYGSDARMVLDATPATQEGKRRIIDTIAALSTEGSTNVAAGLELAYTVAGRHSGEHVTTRVILCSDGVANVGPTGADGILARVKEHADRGVTISTIGFGMGNYNDVLMEQLADKGNGNYAYVDNIDAAQRVFVEQLSATLEVIAKDVKLQVVFDPATVSRYRLLGFENRLLDKRDFDNDHADAGEIGAGHTVTAIYEVKLKSGAPGGNLGTLRVRYKPPTGSNSQLLEKHVPASIVRGAYKDASAPTKLSMVVAAFAEKLRGSYWARNQSYEGILKMWDEIPEALRLRQDVAELRTLIQTARSMDTRVDRFEELLPVARMDFDRVPVLK
jgi:Ca-activated chloride channel family protein